MKVTSEVIWLTVKNIEVEEEGEAEANAFEVRLAEEEDPKEDAKPEANRRAEFRKAKEKGVVRLVEEEEDATSSTCFLN